MQDFLWTAPFNALFSQLKRADPATAVRRAQKEYDGKDDESGW